MFNIFLLLPLKGIFSGRNLINLTTGVGSHFLVSEQRRTHAVAPPIATAVRDKLILTVRVYDGNLAKMIYLVHFSESAGQIVGQFEILLNFTKMLIKCK